MFRIIAGMGEKTLSLGELDLYFRSVLRIDEMAKIDPSLNGIQVARESGRGAAVSRIAFAVDACLESFERAADWGAELLVVHHGLFWGRDLRVEGPQHRRLKFLLSRDIGLYAAHLPLDMHPEIGNNAGLSRLLGLKDVSPFGVYKGATIGCRGILERERSLDEILSMMYGESPRLCSVLPFGPPRVRTVGIVSGGAAFESAQAIEEGLDLYITGEASHSVYHQCLEAGLNIVFGGHYATECWGVRLLAEKTAAETGLVTTFIDVPTGL